MNRLKNFFIFYLIGLLIICSLTTMISAHYPNETFFVLSLSLSYFYIYIVVWFVLWLLVAIWVYKDAEKREKSGVMWIIIVILLGVIGFIIWLLVRGEVPKSGRKCSNCGRLLPMDAKVCPYCGK
ncbi:hypothetical protein AYK20_03315 [Thermoplasmatales archaeon SG8-52-1]|nr:MAG: hypothetical protein AYK20_03315 [Thermoplasmatales archaeon SG8-52-1]